MIEERDLSKTRPAVPSAVKELLIPIVVIPAVHLESAPMAKNKVQENTISEPQFETIQETSQKPRRDEKREKDQDDPAGSKADESRERSARRAGRMPLFGR